jgi:hypothetical protein
VRTGNRGNNGKAEKDKAALDRYLKRDREALRLTGKRLANPLFSPKSPVPARALSGRFSGISVAGNEVSANPCPSSKKIHAAFFFFD